MSPALTALDRDRVATVAMALLVYESPQEDMEGISEREKE
jgi:hypothetical protein